MFTPSQDLYQRVTEKLLEAMERGVVPWVQPWTTTLPSNAVSRRAYRGINVLMTWLHQLEGGYSSSAYLTYKQAQEHGGQVRRGEHGVTVVYYKQVPKSSGPDQDLEKERGYWWLARGYTVFNLDQVDGADGLRSKVATGSSRPFDPIEECERIVHATGAEIVPGDRASYSPQSDTITMPPPATFVTPAAYYSTLFHECAHWSGAAHRLNRDLTGRFGDPRYSFEELVAELTAAFVGARVGIEQVSQSSAYLASWLTALREDRKAIFTAAKLAAAAADFLAPAGERSLGVEMGDAA